jgi:hypothetical protein
VKCKNDGSGCGICSVGYVIDGVGCKKCGEDECCSGTTTEPSVTGCVSCDMYGEKCLGCSKGMKLNKTSGLCVMCRSDECCYSGNGGDVIDGCYSCSPDLKSCSGCVKGKKISNGVCVLCSTGECCGLNTSDVEIKNCSECNDDLSRCVSCTRGYSLNKLGQCIEKNEDGGGGNNTGVIVGVVISVVVIVIIVSVLLILFLNVIPNHKKNGEVSVEMNSVECDLKGLEVICDIDNFKQKINNDIELFKEL